MSRDARALLLDLDDTLYPLRGFRLSGFRAVALHLAGSHGVDADRAYGVLMRASRESARRTALQICLARFGVSAAIVPDLVEMMRSHRPSIRLPGETRGVLTRLKVGWRLGIVTNGRPDLQARKIEALGLHALVDTIVLAQEHTRQGKPDRTPFAVALRSLGVAASRAVFVGDDDRCDLFGASRLGMKTVFCGRYKSGTFEEPRYADAEVATLAALPAVAEALLQQRRSRRAA